MRDHLEATGWPRVVAAVIVGLAGIAGFLVSFALLSAGVSSMPVRYAVAGASAYLAFLVLLGVYVAAKRGRDESLTGGDAIDLLDFTGPSPSLRSIGGNSPHFAGGHSGGGGASAQWGSASSAKTSGGSSWFDGDIDFGWVLLALAAALAGLIAIGYIVWAAPLLLAEVLVDAAIVSAVSRQLVDERRDWTATAIRRTWVPATIVVASLVLGGWALQKIAPDAKSIGPALQSLANR